MKTKKMLFCCSIFIFLTLSIYPGEKKNEDYSLKYLFLNDDGDVFTDKAKNDFFEKTVAKKKEKNTDEQLIRAGINLTWMRDILSFYIDETNKVVYVIGRLYEKYKKTYSNKIKKLDNTSEVFKKINEQLFSDEPKSLLERAKNTLKKLVDKEKFELKEKEEKDKKLEEQYGPFFDQIQSLWLDEDGNLYNYGGANFDTKMIQQRVKITEITLEWARKKVPSLLAVKAYNKALYGIIPFNPDYPDLIKIVSGGEVQEVFSNDFIKSAQEEFNKIKKEKEIEEKKKQEEEEKKKIEEAAKEAELSNTAIAQLHENQLIEFAQALYGIS